MAQTPTTPQRQKQSFSDYIKALNREFSLEIPVPGIESPSSREGNTSPPWQIYKRLRPLFYKGCANGLVVDLREWVVGQAQPPAPINRVSESGRIPCSAARSYPVMTPANSRIVEPSDLPRSLSRTLSVSESARADRMRYLLKLIEDEEYMVTNGRVETTSTRNFLTSTSTSTSTSTTGHKHANQHQSPNQSLEYARSHVRQHVG
ncbi:uncharacterized protein N7511_000372 [Penicillium nucicola]|uniref:uncharacterized protein n=1 Tax=Penicillium nucicola TaxID=1850975 RepID=UPI0025457A69|nr:uncharacterized protein N7511_000372 [Penicillium nucicola]KAJ5775361.1 hypothetical protein N7511_000372 [Penicillium nucicola]